MNFGLKSFASLGVIVVVTVVASIKLYNNYKKNKNVIVLEEPEITERLIESDSEELTDTDDSASYVTVSENKEEIFL